jgi:hypothetical protein
MKRILIILIALLLPAAFVYSVTIDTFEGETVTDAANFEGVTTGDMMEGQDVKAAAGVTYIFSEDFDGSTLCIAAGVSTCDNTWTRFGTAETEDFQDQLADNDGTYNFQVIETSSAGSGVLSPDWSSAPATAYGYFMFNKDTATGSDPVGNAIFFATRDTGDANTGFYLRWDTNDEVECYHGTATTNGGAVLEDTWYHIWWEYTAGSGADGTLVVYISTDPAVKGAADCNIANGNSAITVQKLYMRGFRDATGTGNYYDKIRVDDVTIGASPS